MKRIVLSLICTLILSGTSFSQCFGGQCGGGIRGRFAQRQLTRSISRNISSQIRTQALLNSLAVQNFIAQQSFALPQIQSFVLPQIQSYVLPQTQSFVAPSFVAPQGYTQSAPASAPDNRIPEVTNQLRQLAEMAEALRSLKASP